MSFREWLQMVKGIDVPELSLEQILAGKIQFPYDRHRPLLLFKEYLQNDLAILEKVCILAPSKQKQQCIV